MRVFTPPQAMRRFEEAIMDLEAFEEAKRRLSLSQIGKPALMGIVVLLVMVAVLAAGRLSGAATASEFHISKDVDQQQAEAGQEDGQIRSQTLFVHVSGAVEEPGLYEVGQGGRVADAVRAAGGFSDDAVPESVNLARPLADGEQIVVARASGEGGASGAVDAQGQAQAPASASAGLVNINTASASELESLPGVGEVTAAKIIDYRQANGAFKTIDDLKQVSGIGDKRFEALSGLICV